MTEYVNMNPSYRPVLPKTHSSIKLSRLIKVFNSKILPPILLQRKDITDVRNTVHCSAIATAKVMGFKIETTHKFQSGKMNPRGKKDSEESSGISEKTLEAY
jgi:hypothetical protein